MKPILLASFLAAGLCGCSTAPLSFIVDRDVIDRTDIHRIPVSLVAVDGRSVPRQQPIDPGQHLMTFDAAPIRGGHVPIEKTYPMAILPCTYYYVAGDRANHLSSDWDLVIEDTDKVGGCDPEKEMQKARQSTAGPPLASSSAVLSTAAPQ